MYRLIIADDEPMIVKGISCMADYKSMGFEIVGTCSNGEELLSAVKQNACDVIISDVSMPGKSGIDVLQYIFDNKLPVKVIFISGFSDFEYAHSAIRFGVVDYLLKPVGQKELAAALEKAAAALADSKSAPAENEESALLTKGAKSEHGAIDHSAEFYTVVNISVSETESLQEHELIMLALSEKAANILGESTLVFVKGKYVSAIIGQSVKSASQLRERCENLLAELQKCIDKELRMFIGATVDSMRKIPESYETAAKLSAYAYYTGSRIIDEAFSAVKGNETGFSDLEKCEAALRSSLIGTDEAKFAADVKAAVGTVRRLTFGNVQLTKSYLITLVNFIKRCAGEYAPNEAAEISQTGEKTAREISVSGSFSEDCSAAARCFADMRGIVMSGSSRLPKEIIAAKEYIRNNYRENITLESVAKTVYMNPFYFSAFFKKHTNMNFKEYLNSQRLEEAEKLLLGTNKHIGEIAAEVGFKNARSFSNIFREAYNVTPAEYKKNVKRK